MKTNVQERIRRVKNRARGFFVTGEGIMLAANAGISAKAFGQNVTINSDNLQNADPTAAMGSAIGVLLTMFQFLGIAAAVFGAAQLAMSIIEDQPDKRLKAFAFLGAGVILIGLKFILKGMGFIN